MSDKNRYILLNGTLLKAEEAVIPAVSAGLFYGAGCFETMLAIDGRIQHADDHFERFFRGIDYLRTQRNALPESHAIQDSLHQLIRRNGLEKGRGRVRLQYSLLETSGYRSEKEAGHLLFGEAAPAVSSREPLSLTFTTVSTISSKARPACLKLSNMLHYREAFRIAEESGYDDGILLSDMGAVAETSIANIFWEKENVFYTPSRSCNILPGIIRNKLLNGLRCSYSVVETEADPDVLMDADTVWVTNSIAGVRPVKQVGSRFFPEDEGLTKLLNSLVQE